MIKSLYTIGNVLWQDEAYTEYFEPYSNPFRRSDNIKIIVINIINRKFIDLSESDYKKKSTKELLFREPAGSNSDRFLTPSIPITDKGLDKVIIRLKSTLNGLAEKKITIIDEDELIKITKCIKDYPTNKDKSYIVTFKIDNKWLGEIKEFVDLINKEAYEKYYKKKRGASKSLNSVCSITGVKGEVWGFVDTLGFTVDTTSFLRNGFNMNESYKMFPVSPDAVKKLEGTKRIIFKSDFKLTYDFYGLKFFILPHFITTDNDIIRETIDIFLNKATKKLSIEILGKAIIYNEAILNEILEDEKLSKSGIYYDIFFYQIIKKQFMIKLHLSDVLPSRLKEIFQVKKAVEDKYQIINRIFVSAGNRKNVEKIREYKINFGGFYEKGMPPIYGIKDYFSQKTKKGIIYHSYFFKILEVVFYGSLLNKEVILKAFMEKIISAFKNVKENPNDFVRHIKISFTIHHFFCDLKLFNSNIMEDNNILNKDSVLLNLQGFIEQHTNFFRENEPVMKGAFYLGCLTEKMLLTQKKYYKFSKPYQEPFLKHLGNLNFDVKALLSISNKLNTFHKYQSILTIYDFNEITKLQQKAEQFLILPTRLSRAELSYCFALGMAMQREFVNYAKQKKIQKNEEATQKIN